MLPLIVETLKTHSQQINDLMKAQEEMQRNVQNQDARWLSMRDIFL